MTIVRNLLSQHITILRSSEEELSLKAFAVWRPFLGLRTWRGMLRLVLLTAPAETLLTALRVF